MPKLSTASVLAFERRLDISDACFWQKDNASTSADMEPLEIKEKSVRGTISNRSTVKPQEPNLQTVDFATLDDDKNTLLVKWSCKVLPFAGKPSICNQVDYQAKLMETVKSYIQTCGFTPLAKRYAANIANARWLWRNRISAESIKVKINCNFNGKNETLLFKNAKTFNLNDFSCNDEQLDMLTQWIEMGLSDEKFIILNIEAEAMMGYGQEVYPSQELILDTGSRKSKVLYSVNNKAGMHSQKIGNAIRTIDNWYESEEVHSAFPIAIEPYGAVTTLGKAFRQPKKAHNDFYSLLDNWVLKDRKPSEEAQHYVIAVLIRGGVFGDSGRE